jgi:hypothetical protein
MTTTLLRCLLGALLAAAAHALPVANLRAQTPPDTSHVDKTFFTRRDAVLTGIAIAGTAAVSVFDERIARWTRSENVQGEQSRRDLFDNLTQ